MDYQIEPEPLISVILPVRNNEAFLKECLDSLHSQNYKNTEIIAIDDFSTDNSPHILRSFKQRDKRIKLFRNVKKYGLATTLNRAIRRSKGGFLVFMDPSDRITANKFSKQITFLQHHPKAVAVGTQCTFIDAQGTYRGKSTFPANSPYPPLHGVSLLMTGIMVNRYAIPRDLLHFSAGKQAFLYADMAIKLMPYGELMNLPEFLHFHRKQHTIDSLQKHLFSVTKLWFSSRFHHGISLPLRSLFSPLLFSS